MDLTEINEKFAALELLEDNFDDEGAEKPNEIAFKAAYEVVGWAFENWLDITDIDADVLGGIAVWLGNIIWISCSNRGSVTATINHSGKIVSGQFEDMKKTIYEILGD